MNNYTVYTCGSNLNAQLGIGTTEDIKVVYEPQQIKKIENERIISISTGSNHSLALSIDGRVFGWGSNEKHQLGFPEKSLKC